MEEIKMDNKVLIVGIVFGIIFSFGVVRMMVAGSDGLWAVLIGLIGIICVYLYDKKNS